MTHFLAIFHRWLAGMKNDQKLSFFGVGEISVFGSSEVGVKAIRLRIGDSIFWEKSPKWRFWL